jgi:hypothetical protein
MELCLGIGRYNQKPLETQIAQAQERFYQNGNLCECCGISIMPQKEHIHMHRGTCFITCSYCYYTEHLEEIPSFDKGHITYAPFVSQVEINNLTRASYALKVAVEGHSDSHSTEVIELTNTHHAIENVLSRVIGRTERSLETFKFKSPDVLATAFYNVPQELYNEARHRAFEHHRIIFDENLVKDQMSYWAEHDFKAIRSSNFDTVISHFMSAFGTDVEIRQKAFE